MLYLHTRYQPGALTLTARAACVPAQRQFTYGIEMAARVSRGWPVPITASMYEWVHANNICVWILRVLHV